MSRLSPLFLASVIFAICANGSPILSGKVTVTVDMSEAPDMREYGPIVKKYMENWFPFVEALIYSPTYEPVTQITVKFERANKGICQSNFVDRFISCNPEFFRQFRTQVGFFIHEMTHIIHQAIGKCPGWVVEGMAEWTRRWHFQPWTKGEKPKDNDNLDAASGAWLLTYLNTDIAGKPMIFHINEACRQGTFNSNTILQLSGKSEEEWFKQMKSDTRIPWN